MSVFLAILGIAGLLMSAVGLGVTVLIRGTVMQEIAGYLLLGQGLVLASVSFGLGSILSALEGLRRIAAGEPKKAPWI